MTNAEWSKQVAVSQLAKAIANVTLTMRGGYVTETIEEFLKPEKERLIAALREMNQLAEDAFHGFTSYKDAKVVEDYFAEKHAVVTNFIVNTDGWCEDAIIYIWHSFTLNTATSTMVYRHYFNSGVTAELVIEVPTGIKNLFSSYCTEVWQKKFTRRQK